MAFLNKTMLAKMAGEATAEKHPMLEKHEVPRSVKTAYLQGCVLAGVLKDGVLPEAKKADVLRLGLSLQLADSEISDCIAIVTGLATDEAKEQFVGEIFSVLAGDTYPKYFLKDFEALLMEDGKLPGEMVDYLDCFGSTLCNDKNWRKILAEEKQNDVVAAPDTSLAEELKNSRKPESEIRSRVAADYSTGGHYILPDKCVGCGCCKETCPAEAISEGSPYWIDSDKCVDCGACAESCPIEAIIVR